MTETLRDRHGNKIGTLDDNGSQIVLRDSHGNKVGTGNLLTTLLR